LQNRFGVGGFNDADRYLGGTSVAYIKQKRVPAAESSSYARLTGKNMMRYGKRNEPSAYMRFGKRNGELDEGTERKEVDDDDYYTNSGDDDNLVDDNSVSLKSL
jgi:hypothetical protein